MEDVWRLYMGPWFGEPEMMLLSEVAARLGISEWHAENIVRATDAAVVPQAANSERNTGRQIYASRFSSPLPSVLWWTTVSPSSSNLDRIRCFCRRSSKPR